MSRLGKLFVIASTFILGSQTTLLAQSITMVEEDWELDLNTPNSSKSSPQLTCAMSPLGDCNSLYATFDINKRSIDAKGGGLQVEIWYADNLAAGGSPVGNFREHQLTVRRRRESAMDAAAMSMSRACSRLKSSMARRRRGGSSGATATSWPRPPPASTI